MAHLSIALYRPKEGKEEALLALVHGHVPRLREIGLANDYPPVLLRSKDGTLLEIFEWVSTEAIDAAHQHPAVMAMWGEFGEACDYVRLADLPEVADLFPHFERL